MKQDESDGDPKFTTTIGLGGKSTGYWKLDIKQSWKWKGICKAYRNPTLKFDVGHMNSDNKKKACGA